MNTQKILLLILCSLSFSLADGLDDAFEAAPVVANYCVVGGTHPKFKLTKVITDTPVIYLAEADSMECSCYSAHSRSSFDLPMKPGVQPDCSGDSSFYARGTCKVKNPQLVPASYKFEIPKEYEIPQEYFDMHGKNFVKTLYKKKFLAFLEARLTCNDAEPFFLEQRFKVYISGPCK